MALLAEELVEEWLNRQGYFTIRGIRIGVDEIDLLAIRIIGAEIEYRHIEVQASMRPVSPISRVPRELQRQGRAPNSAKRTPEELETGVSEWVEKKFFKARKIALIEQLAPVKWTSELVVNNVKVEAELELIAAHGVLVRRLRDIVRDLRKADFPIKSASGADFVDLVNMGNKLQEDTER